MNKRQTSEAASYRALSFRYPGRVIIGNALRPAIQRMKAAESVQSAAERYYINDSGSVFIPEASYLQLRQLILNYDVNLSSGDVRRRQSDKDESVGSIAIGLVALVQFVNLDDHIKHQARFIIHPGCHQRPDRDRTYKGRSLEQILEMCGQGHECHNDLAQALSECLSTLKPD